MSKTLNIDFIKLATKVILGVPHKSPEIPHLDYIGVKVPQFSFIRLKGIDPVLGAEMASTGEVTPPFTHSSPILTFQSKFKVQHTKRTSIQAQQALAGGIMGAMPNTSLPIADSESLALASSVAAK
jgi:hypothetical protein